MKELHGGYRDAFVAACLGERDASARALYAGVCAELDRIGAAARAVDAAAVYPAAALDALQRAQAIGLTVPRAYGGAGAGDPLAALLVETLAHACPSTAAILMFHYQVVRRSARFAPRNRLLAGDLAAFAAAGRTGVSGWTEPGARGDKSATRTVALAAPAGTLRLDGLKSHVTGLRAGAVAHVLCKVGGTDLSFVRVGIGPGGAAIGELYDLQGLRASATGSIVLDAVAVPSDSVVGEVGAGPALMRSNHEVLLNPGLIALGVASAALDHVLEVLLARDAGGDAARGERARRLTAECEIALRAAYALAAQLVTRSGDDSANLRFKVFAAQTAVRVVAALAELSGSESFHSGTPLERAVRDVRAAALMGPTNDAIVTRIGKELAEFRPAASVAVEARA